MEGLTANEAPVRAGHAMDISADAPDGTSRLRAAVRLAVFFLITLHYCIIAMLTRLPGTTEAAHRTSGTRLIMRWSRRVNRALGLEVSISGKIPSEAALLASNHRSYLDITAIGASLPVTFLAKSELGRWPLIGPACSLVDVVFVDRESAASRWKARGEIDLRLTNGLSIVVFPEGTSFEGPGLLAFRPGAFSIAASGGFGVVPVAVSCERPADAWVGSDTFIRHFMQTFSRARVRMTVSFGPIIRSNEPERLRHFTWKWIAASLKETSRSQYDRERYHAEA